MNSSDNSLESISSSYTLMH